MKMVSKVQISKSERFYAGFYPILKTVFSHLRFDGTWSRELERETVRRGKIVAVLPYDRIKDRVVLIEQFRIGAYLESERHDTVQKDGVIWETVSGYVDKGESPEEAARRELFEESGLITTELASLGSVLANPGMCDERLLIYCAYVDSAACEGIFGLATEDEDIRVSAIDRSVAMEMVKNGQIDKASAIISLYKLQDFLDE